MFASVVDQIAERLRRRGVRRLVYFHCDHFEPWRNVHGSLSPANSDHVAHFIEATAQNDQARRLTLFYRCHLKPTMEAREGAVFAEDTPLGFVRPSEADVAVARRGIGRVPSESNHEIQVHIHHEYVTRNDRYCRLSKWGADFFDTVDTPEMDRRRVALLIDLSLETIRRETGLGLDEWFFIHGNWALNGSDRNVCTIDDEILMLRARGCRGDFTFPAEDPHLAVNPSFHEPVLIRPFAGAKCYDRPEADARAAWGARAIAADPERFFVWSSPSAIWPHLSLDYHFPAVAERCADPGAWALHLADQATVHGGTLWLGTYAHSMNLRYTVDGRTVFPHQHGPIRTMLGALFDAVGAIGGDVVPATAAEVHRRVVESEDRHP